MAWSRRFGIGVIVMMLAALTPVRAQDRIDVVASFSILGDFARAVGGAVTPPRTTPPRELSDADSAPLNLSAAAGLSPVGTAVVGGTAADASTQLCAPPVTTR